MYESYWGLKTSPFRKAAEAAYFHAGPVHEEASARLSYLVEDRRRFGLVYGPAGMGKSLLLTVLADEVRRAQQRTVAVDLTGRTADELALELARQTGAFPAPATAFEAWTALADHTAALAAFEHQCVVLLDDFDAADAVAAGVRRLLNLADHYPGTLTVVAASRTRQSGGANERLVELVDLQAELAPLSADESAAYVNDLLEQAGRREPAFESDALAEVAVRSGGVPRRINQLVELCLLAGMADERKRLSADVVRQVCTELRDQPTEAAEPAFAA